MEAKGTAKIKKIYINVTDITAAWLWRVSSVGSNYPAQGCQLTSATRREAHMNVLLRRRRRL